MQNLKILILSLFLVLIYGTVLAQEIPEVVQDEKVLPQDLEISEPKVLPDNPVYFLKDWIRGIKLFLVFDPQKKAELRLKMANEKLMEAEKLAELRKDPKLIERTVNDFQNEIGKISQESGENLKKFSEKLIHQQVLHQKILQRLETQVPPEVFEKIKANRERHLERFAQVMQKIETKEKIAERLENELEKIKGSKFKEFKDLEVLDEIQEKMPQDVKEKIKQKREKILERLRERLEGMSDEEKEKFKTYSEQILGNKLRQLKIMGDLEKEEISEKLREAIEKAKERKIEQITKEPITLQKAKEMIEKADNEIKKAQEVLNKIEEKEKGQEASKRLLELAKKHLEQAKEAFEKENYGRAWGLATAAYHEALNVQRIAEKIETIKKRPEQIKKKIEQLYPGIKLPEKVECPQIQKPKCASNEVWRVERDEKGCPLFVCEKIKTERKGRKPEVCIMVWDPVCGQDGKTYSNACFAQMAGVEILHKGVCEKIEPRL